MLRSVEVFCGVFVLGRVTTTHVAAGQTLAEVYPGISHLETLFATLRARFYVLDPVQMRTLLLHVISFRFALGRLLRFGLVGNIEGRRIQGLGEVVVTRHARYPSVAHYEHGADGTFSDHLSGLR